MCGDLEPLDGSKEGGGGGKGQKAARGTESGAVGEGVDLKIREREALGRPHCYAPLAMAGEEAERGVECGGVGREREVGELEAGGAHRGGRRRREEASNSSDRGGRREEKGARRLIGH